MGEHVNSRASQQLRCSGGYSLPETHNAPSGAFALWRRECLILGGSLASVRLRGTSLSPCASYVSPFGLVRTPSRETASTGRVHGWVGMGLKINRLAARWVVTVTELGYDPDGGGLYLQVTASGAKSWVFRYRFEGRHPEMGLGPLHVIGLADARVAADSARKLIQAGQTLLPGGAPPPLPRHPSRPSGKRL